jgi:hypothetical protein
MVRLAQYLPVPWNDLIFWLLFIVCGIVALIVLLVKRKQIMSYWKSCQDDPQCTSAFWSAPGIITLVVVLSAMTVFSMITLVLA